MKGALWFAGTVFLKERVFGTWIEAAAMAGKFKRQARRLEDTNFVFHAILHLTRWIQISTVEPVTVAKLGFISAFTSEGPKIWTASNFQLNRAGQTSDD